jgi:drug/metabolite transporter (DMT)-like permease
VAYLLALLSAAFYGAADFLGGLAARGAATIAVVIVTQASGLIVLAMLLPVLPASTPAPRDLWWGLAAGITGSVGVALLYRALAIGTMAIVAPTTAVCAVIIPVIAGLLLGERPAAHTIAGIGIALVAIALVSQSKPDAAAPSYRGPLPRGLGLALMSGVAIGFFFLCLARTNMEAGLTPLLVARGASLVLFGVMAAGRTTMRMPRRVFGIAVMGGILDMLANAFYVVAVREGPLTVVVTLSSLYPASTVLLARVVLRERLRGVQVAGIVAALAAVALIVR